MLIGTQYADNKLYRGIKHYDKMPLTSGDIHEYADTEYMKNAYIMNNLLGYGTLNVPDIVDNAGGISLSSPSIVMIDGDISLIQSDENVPLVSKDKIIDAGHSAGLICILGWYQHISAGSVLKNYGGVDNSDLPNDLLNTTINMQVSSRFQFRWFPVIVNAESYSGTSISIEVKDRDANGVVQSTTSTLTSSLRNNNVFIIEKPSKMSYAESDLYLVPILSYTYDDNDNDIVSTKAADPLSVSSKLSILQYQSAYVMPTTVSTVSDIEIPINIEEYTMDDILSVSYEGLLLYRGENYTIDYENQTIKLLGFTVDAGDVVHFNVTKLVSIKNITDITSVFTSHMNTRGNATIEGHLKLSDTLSTSSQSDGIAATPKLVNALRNEILGEIEDLEGLAEDVSGLGDRISDVESDITTLQGNISNINGDISTINSSITDINGNILTMNSSITDLGESIDGLEFSKVNDYSGDLKSSTKIYDTLSHIIDENEDESLKTDLSSAYSVSELNSKVSTTTNKVIATPYGDFKLYVNNKIAQVYAELTGLPTSGDNATIIDFGNLFSEYKSSAPYSIINAYEYTDRPFAPIGTLWIYISTGKCMLYKPASASKAYISGTYIIE